MALKPTETEDNVLESPLGSQPDGVKIRVHLRASISRKPNLSMFRLVFQEPSHEKGSNMSTVRLEIMPWLSHYFTIDRSRRAILEAEVGDGATVLELLRAIASQNQDFEEVLFDAQTGRVAAHISLILNGRLLGLAGGLQAELRPGDTLRLTPAFGGG
jgi:hypothetical protein